MASSPLENDLDLTLFVACYNEDWHPRSVPWLAARSRTTWI
jgi:hypothetical protein